MHVNIAIVSSAGPTGMDDVWLLTFEWDCALCKARVFCFPHAEQGGREERVVDEILHVVALAFIFGFRAHLVGYVLPAGEKNSTHVPTLASWCSSNIMLSRYLYN